MRYKSNLDVPDLRSQFKLRNPPLQMCGHDIPSDPDFEPNCGYWSDDEAAILYNVAAASNTHGRAWLDIGSRFGWTAKHVNWVTNGPVTCVDPCYGDIRLFARFLQNMPTWPASWIWPGDSNDFFRNAEPLEKWAGFVIDANHDAPCPLEDAMNCDSHSYREAIILFHDFWGKPIRDAVNWLIGQGYSCRVYFTPNGVACCWRGLPDFAPPDHVRDPAIDWSGFEHIVRDDFDLGRCV